MESKTDRRVRRTRALLLQALIRLMEEKEIKDISVKELSELADINRGTFYLHYNDIYDMLGKVEDELFSEFHEILDRTMKEGSQVHSPQTVLTEIFSFLERHRDLTKVMMGPHGDLAFVNRLKTLVGERIYSIISTKNSKNNCLYIEAFTISGCVGVIETWLKQVRPADPEEMAVICSNMLLKGLDLE